MFNESDSSDSEDEHQISKLCQNHLLDLLIADTSEEEELMDDFNMQLMVLLMDQHHANTRNTYLPDNESSMDSSISMNSEPNISLQHSLNNFSDDRFRQMLPVNSQEFQHILDLIKDHPVFLRTTMPVDVQLQITLCRLGTSDKCGKIRNIARLFELSYERLAQEATRCVFKAILALRKQYLYWPNNLEREKIVAKSKHELPGCIGYLGATEIKLVNQQLLTDDSDFYSQIHHQTTMKLQLVCDKKLLIRSVSAGHPGGRSDEEVFYKSAIYKRHEHLLSLSQWVGAGIGYPLKQYLITPIERNASNGDSDVCSKKLPSENIDKFNEQFEVYRSRVEHCFDSLRQRFGSLAELNCRKLTEFNLNQCNEWATVCCILHNILILRNSEEESDEEDSRPIKVGREVGLLTGEDLRMSLVNLVCAEN